LHPQSESRSVTLPIISRREFTGLLGSAVIVGKSAFGREPARKLDEPLLNEIERRAVRYFLEQANPRTGLVKDRCRATGLEVTQVASIAATGFGLSALCIADKRRFLPRGEARRRAARTLHFLASKMGHEHGFFWHFSEARNGERAWGSEASSIDTAWLLCGALHAKAHFNSPAIDRSVREIVERVDWAWMLDGRDTLSHGWTPQGGFLPYRWDAYSELMSAYLLAMGSKTYPIPGACWDAWQRPVTTEGPYSFIGCGTPLFTHQYSHAWFDFRGKQDVYADYFENSRQATLANRLACIRVADDYPWYSENLWGVTASDSRGGYGGCEKPDGLLVPCAAGGSLPFLPAECTTVLKHMLERYGSRVWGRYGFIDAFHPGQTWFGPDVIGIDQGIMLLMAENARTGSVWEAFMSTPEAQRGMAAAGFKSAAPSGSASKKPARGTGRSGGL
jgi:hypothetical protein